MPAYVFLDESGEFVFKPHSGRYLVFAGVVTSDPLLLNQEFSELKYELLAQGECLERFHACDDNQAIRNRVFDLISKANGCAVHSVVVRKNRVNPSLYRYGAYSIAYKTLLKYLTGLRGIKKLHIVADTVPDKGQAVVLKQTLKNRAEEVLGQRRIEYTISHHVSAAHALLQAADYCAWAIYKKWHAGDTKSYDLIRGSIRNEYDIFWKGDREYY